MNKEIIEEIFAKVKTKLTTELGEENLKGRKFYEYLNEINTVIKNIITEEKYADIKPKGALMHIIRRKIHAL